MRQNSPSRSNPCFSEDFLFIPCFSYRSHSSFRSLHLPSPKLSLWRRSGKKLEKSSFWRGSEGGAGAQGTGKWTRVGITRIRVTSTTAVISGTRCICTDTLSCKQIGGFIENLNQRSRSRGRERCSRYRFGEKMTLLTLR